MVDNKRSASSLPETSLAASKMDSKNWKAVSCSKKRKVVCRTKKRKEEDSCLPCLPEEIVFNVLVLLPADILYNAMRYVCRGWYNIIKNPDFIQANLLRSTAGLFIQNRARPHPADFAELVECNVQTRPVRFEIPFVVATSCDGLILFWLRRKKVFCIANPVTKQQVPLPPLPPLPAVHNIFGLVYVPSLRRYKVAHAYRERDTRHLVVLTFGVDKVWRPINIEHIPCDVQRMFNRRLYSAGKFVCWASVWKPYLLALDIESEIIYQLPSPAMAKGGVVGRRHCFGTMESKLCLMAVVAELQWQVWVLDMELRGEWLKLFNLDLTGALSSMFGQMARDLDYNISSYLWLRNGEVVVFIVHTCIVVHSVKTGEFRSFDMEEKNLSKLWSKLVYLKHVNSLVTF